MAKDKSISEKDLNPAKEGTLGSLFKRAFAQCKKKREKAIAEKKQAGGKDQ